MSQPSRARRGVAAAIAFSLIVLSFASRAPAATILDPVEGGPITDVVSLEGTYDADNLYFTVTLVPWTLLASPFGFAGIISLDTDLDPATGSACPGNFCGADWRVTLRGGLDSTGGAAFGFATLRRTGDLATELATVPILYSGYANEIGKSSVMRIIMPLDPDPLVGLPDDGQTYFNLLIGESSGGGGFSVQDTVPDGAPYSQLAGPTTLVPEPSTAFMLGSGLLGLAGHRYGRGSRELSAR